MSLARRLRIAGRRLGIGQWRETGDAAGDFLLGVFPPIVLRRATVLLIDEASAGAGGGDTWALNSG